MPDDKQDFKSPELIINRELSWLEFNDRVMQQGLSDEVPLMERLKFLAIVSSNLDEFFMIRVAGLVQQRSAGVNKPDFSGMTPSEQLSAISRRIHRMSAEQTAGIRSVLAGLAEHGLCVLGAERLELETGEIPPLPLRARDPSRGYAACRSGIRGQRVAPRFAAPHRTGDCPEEEDTGC